MPKASDTYRILPRAVDDLVEIWDYTTATWSVEQAVRYEDQILDHIETVAADPNKGDDISHLRTGYRLWRVARHFIIYRRGEQGIDVVRILHQRRDIKRHV